MKIIGFLLALALVSCAYNENQKELYNQQKLGFDPITITIPTKIELTKVKPSKVAQWCSIYLNWLPWGCNLVNFPVNFAMAIVPPVPFKERTPLDLPEDVPWTDPKILPYIKSVRVLDGRIRIVPLAQRQGYKAPRCWFKYVKLGKMCPTESLKFLTEIQINLVFSPKIIGDCRKVAKTHSEQCMLRKKGQEKCLKRVEARLEQCRFQAQAEIDARRELPEQIVPLAKATINEYETTNHVLPFTMTKTNLRPYLDKYKDFSVDIAVKGKYPKRETWIDGDLKLEFVVQLPEPY